MHVQSAATTRLIRKIHNESAHQEANLLASLLMYETPYEWRENFLRRAQRNARQ
jgi:hypothetical protein